MDKDDETESLTSIDEKEKKECPSVVESALLELKAAISTLYNETALFPHSCISQEKVILPSLLNLAKHCDLIRITVVEREKLCDIKAEKKCILIAQKLVLQHLGILEDLENRLDKVLLTSGLLQTAMNVFFEQLHFSVPCSPNSWVYPEFLSLKCKSEIPDGLFFAAEGDKEKVTNQESIMKLQNISLKMQELEGNMANCQNLSMWLTSLMAKNGMINEPEKLIEDPVLIQNDHEAVSSISKVEVNWTDTNDGMKYENKKCHSLREKIAADSWAYKSNFNSNLQIPLHIPIRKNSKNSTSARKAVKHVKNRNKYEIMHSKTGVEFFKAEDVELFTKQYVTNGPMTSTSSSEALNTQLRISNYCDIDCLQNIALPQNLHFEREISYEKNCDKIHLIFQDDSLFDWKTNFHSFKNTFFYSDNSQSVITKVPLSSHDSNISLSVNIIDLAKFIKYLMKEKSSLQDKHITLIHTIEKLENSKADLEKQLFQLRKQSFDVSSKKDDFRKRADFIISKEREEFHQKINLLRQERESLADQVNRLENETSSLQAELAHVKQLLLVNKVNQEQDVAALRLQLSAESLRYEKALKRHAEHNNSLVVMKNKLCNQEQVITDLEISIGHMKVDLEAERKEQLQELEEIYIALGTRDDECMALSDELKKCVAARDELLQRNSVLLSCLSEMKITSDNIKAEMEARLNMLKCDSDVMRKKLIKLIREKDMLWQRTDHLTHLQKVQVSGRWMEDTEVTHCLGCKHRFKFTLRKHHCRLCGKIFCYSCANKWLLTAASRCRTRVCNECFDEHQQLKKVVKDGSSVHMICKDSEEDEIIESSSFQGSKWDSTMASSINSIFSVGVDSADAGIHDLSLMSHEENLSNMQKRDEDTYSPDIEMYKNCNFDVITDEEIEKSLSTCSPYNPSLLEPYEDYKINSGLSLTLTRTIEEIETAGMDGVSGEIWISAGMRSGIPVLCNSPPSELHWKLICDYKTVTFAVLRKENDTTTEVILPSNCPQKEDSAMFFRSGLYILQFDNSFSRVKARKVQYTLWTKPKSYAESSA